MLLKKVEISRSFNSLALMMILISIVLMYQPDVFVLSALCGCFLLAILMKIPYKLATIIILYFLIPSDAVSYMFVDSPFGKFPLYIVFMLLFIIMGIISKKSFTTNINKNEFFIYFGLIILIVGQIMCILAFSNNTIISNLVKFSFQTLGILLIVKTSKINETDVYRICWFIVILSILTVCEGAYEVFGKFDLYDIYGNKELSEWIEWTISSSENAWRAKSTFANPLIFSSTMVLSLTSIEYIKEKDHNDLIILLLVGILSVGMILGGSRSAIFILIIYLGKYIKESNLKRKIIAFFGIVLIGFIIISYMDMTVLMDRFTEIGKDKSLSHRLYSYQIFVSIFIKYGLYGVGLGNTYNILQNVISDNFVVNTFDNAFMDFSLAVGVIGVIALIFVFKGVFGICLKKNNCLLKMSILLFICLSFFLNTTKYQSLWGMLWIYISLNIYSIPKITNERICKKWKRKV